MEEEEEEWGEDDDEKEDPGAEALEYARRKVKKRRIYKYIFESHIFRRKKNRGKCGNGERRESRESREQTGKNTFRNRFFALV